MHWETLEQRNAGKTADVIKTSMQAVIPFIKDWTRVVIAYEPIWAIGTGVVASPQQAQEAHAVTRKIIADAAGKEIADKVRIVYGGSVSDGNCDELAKEVDIDGFLVGGASLKPTFVKIIKSVV
eukprot:GHVU01120639.1.p1 GENE.GHVU01120639.1~~GHVU01120639.1.p1  ORF type:complete len:124 (-),score=18.85 GHVU01120639.1:58-429(-)